MTEEEKKPLDYISDMVLKKRKNNEQWAIKRKEQLEPRDNKHKTSNFVIQKPEQFIREFHDKGGGHVAPEFKPPKCTAMLERWTYLIDHFRPRPGLKHSASNALEQTVLGL